MIGSLAAGATVALAGCGRKDDVVDSTQDLTDGSTIPEPAGEAGEQESRKGGTLKYYINNPVAIDPFNVQEDQGMQVAYQLFDTLTTYDFEAGEIVGLAAESWEANETADVFTLKLVPGATLISLTNRCNSGRSNFPPDSPASV